MRLMLNGNLRIVLVRPRGAANVGAVARAMKNMGVLELALVHPAPMRTFWSQAMAVHANDLLQSMTCFDTLGRAVADCGLVVGTTCRGGLYRAAAEPVRAAAPRLAATAATNRVALVFGPEDHGLSNKDLQYCHQLITIPASPAYPSLNLAQAVMICCYELFLAAGEKSLGAGSMVRNNMLVETVVTGSLQRRNAERPGGRSAGGRAALGRLRYGSRCA